MKKTYIMILIGLIFTIVLTILISSKTSDLSFIYAGIMSGGMSTFGLGFFGFISENKK